MLRDYEITLADGVTHLVRRVKSAKATEDSLILFGKRDKILLTFQTRLLRSMRKLNPTDRHGRKKQVFLNPAAKLEVLAFRNTGLTCRQVAEKYGVTDTVVWKLWRENLQ